MNLFWRNPQPLFNLPLIFVHLCVKHRLTASKVKPKLAIKLQHPCQREGHPMLVSTWALVGQACFWYCQERHVTYLFTFFKKIWMYPTQLVKLGGGGGYLSRFWVFRAYLVVAYIRVKVQRLSLFPSTIDVFASCQLLALCCGHYGTFPLHLFILL